MELATQTPFTPFAATFGGILIGLSAVLVMALFGRITGISGITSALLPGSAHDTTAQSDTGWRLAFIIGLILAPLLYAAASGSTVAQTVPTSLIAMAAAGLIVGFGTAIGSGCTSGHGVCGLARLSPRSLVAVLSFMASAGITVFLLRHVL